MKRYIRASESEYEDYGYGFTSNGDPITESDVEQLVLIANGILEHSKLAQFDEYVDIEDGSFDYNLSSPFASVKYTIIFDASSNDVDVNSFIDAAKADARKSWGVSLESDKYEVKMRFYIAVKNNQMSVSVDDIEVYENGRYNEYLSSEYDDILDKDALCDFVMDMAAPAVNEIFDTVTNL